MSEGGTGVEGMTRGGSRLSKSVQALFRINGREEIKRLTRNWMTVERVDAMLSRRQGLNGTERNLESD
jgi:hypothetical protein